MAADQTKSTDPSAGSLRDRVLAVWEGGAASCEPALGERIVVGRSRDCGLRVAHGSVSRHHAALVLGRDGWTVEDLDSQHGSWLGEERLVPRRAVSGVDGIAIRVGSALVFVQRAGGARRRRKRAGASMAALSRTLELIAGGEIAVLLLGETGVGKEVLAARIHAASRRRQGPFVRVHCAALPEPLLESELFGHERGAFTGAHQRKPGLLETANGGTVFLDEVGELPAAAQAKLLRALEQREVMRVGAVQASLLDVRFVSATNRDLEQMVAAGTFRADLYYRLAGYTMAVPPLRERLDELPALARSFAAEACAALGREPPALAPDTLACLTRYDWPGNIRQLRNVIECAVILATEGVIRPEALPSRLRSRRTAAASRPRPSELRAELSAIERQRILDALDRCGGNQTHAARLLGIGRRTLLKRLDAYEVPRPRGKRS